MVKNARILRCFEDRLIASEKVNIKQNYRILNALYQEAVALGVFPLKDPLEGVENDIRLARKLNRVSRSA